LLPHSPSFPTRRSSDLTVQILRGHDIRSLSVFIPCGKHNESLLPVKLGILFKICVTYPDKSSLIIGYRHIRVSLSVPRQTVETGDRKSTRLNSSHVSTS